MTPLSIKHVPIPLVLGALSLLGCPPRVLPRNPTEQLVEWMLGRENKSTPQSPDVVLGNVPKDKLKPSPAPKPPPKPPKRSEMGVSAGVDPSNVVEKRSECIRASSFVPAPEDDGRFFLAVDGALHVMRPGDKTTMRLDGLADGVSIIKLAAIRKVSEGLELLAWVNVEGKSETDMHALVVNASSIIRSGVADIRVERIEDLFPSYMVPRCTTSSTQCLEISQDAEKSTYLDLRSRATGTHAPPTTLAKIPGLVDATWTPKNDGSVYVLQRCDASGSESP